MNVKQISLLFVFLFLIGGCARKSDDVDQHGGSAEGSETTGNIAVATPPATQLPRAGTTILANGQLVARKSVLPLGFAVGGRVVAVHVQPGDVVEQDAILATLDGTALSNAVTVAELQAAQAEIALDQAQLGLENLIGWEPDEMTVALAEANLIAAEANYESALVQDSSADNSLTSARVAVDQAERALADVQKAYDTAWDSAREWELGVPGRKEMLEYERDATTRALQNAGEGLEIARANYNLASAGLNDNRTLNAEASIAGAQQALNQARTGPKESEIAAARLQVEQAKLSSQQAEFNLDQARQSLEDAVLVAPWRGTVLSIDAMPGALVGGGTPILTLLDVEDLQFLTTNLSERDLADIAPGQMAQISLIAYPGREINGTLARVVPQSGGLLGDAAIFVVVIDLDPVDLLLLPGMTGRAEIHREG